MRLQFIFHVFTILFLKKGYGQSSNSSSTLPVFSSCGGATTALRGVITSPMYPQNYENGLVCLWTIDTPRNTTVEIIIEGLGIENSEGCIYDYLVIVSQGQPGTRFCGGFVSGPGTASNPLIKRTPVNLTLVSDQSVTGIGFQMFYQGGVCMERMVDIRDVNITSSDGCLVDFMRLLFHGGTPEAYRLCGSNPGKSRSTEGHGPFEVVFRTGVESPSSKGFELEYKVLSPCLSNPCQNGATCEYEGSDSPYNCVCVTGYTGVNCELDIDDCASTPCQNDGTCLDAFNDYSCQCQEGTSGENCEIIDNRCILQPCKNGATCTPENNSYNCKCVAGYEGSNCDQERNECISGPCRNGGTCEDLLDDYSCSCPDQYSGVDCEIFTAPTTMPIPTSDAIEEYICQDDNSICMNGGTCVEDVRLNLTTCICPTGYEGRLCEIQDTDDSTLFKALIGAAGGVILLLIVLSIVLCYFLSKRNSKKAPNSQEEHCDEFSSEPSQNNLYTDDNHYLSSQNGDLAQEISECVKETSHNGIQPDVELILGMPMEDATLGETIIPFGIPYQPPSYESSRLANGTSFVDPPKKKGKKPSRHTWTKNTVMPENSDYHRRRRSSIADFPFQDKRTTNENELNGHANDVPYLHMPEPPVVTNSMTQGDTNAFPSGLRRNEAAISREALRQIRKNSKNQLNTDNEKHINKKTNNISRIRYSEKKKNRRQNAVSKKHQENGESGKRSKTVNKIRERILKRDHRQNDSGLNGFTVDNDSKRNNPKEEIYTGGITRQSAFVFDGGY